MKRIALVAFAVCILAGSGWYGYGGFVRAQAPRIIAEARRALLAGRAAEARQSLDRVLSFDPTDCEARLLQGLALRQANDLDGARAALQRIPESSNAFRSADFELSLISLQEGAVDDAETRLVRLVERFPDFHEPADELRWLYFNTFRQRALEEFLEARLARTPGDVETLTHLLMTEFRSPVPREGIGYLQQMDQKRPGQPGILRALAWCQWQLGQIDDARLRIDDALEQSAESPEVLLLALSFLVEQGELDTARTLSADIGQQSANEAAGSLARDDRWWWTLSNLEEHSGNAQQSLELLNRALEIRPFELKYIHRRGVILQKLRRPDEAAVDFQRSNVLESCATRLTEIVLSGALERLTRDICRELAELSEKRGRALQAAGWRLIRDRGPAAGRPRPVTEGRQP